MKTNSLGTPKYPHEPLNSMRLELAARSVNESFARSTVAAFAAQLNPTLEEIDDIKTAVSEAVTNCVVHAYADTKHSKVVLECELFSDRLVVRVMDTGEGISDVEHAMQPFVTTRGNDERSGMGFTVMQSFMDSLDVSSKPGKGTTVVMQKFLGTEKKAEAM